MDNVRKAGGSRQLQSARSFRQILFVSHAICWVSTLNTLKPFAFFAPDKIRAAINTVTASDGRVYRQQPYPRRCQLNMRKRKKALYARLYIGFLAAALLAELEEAADALRAALES